MPGPHTSSLGAKFTALRGRMCPNRSLGKRGYRFSGLRPAEIVGGSGSWRGSCRSVLVGGRRRSTASTCSPPTVTAVATDRSRAGRAAARRPVGSVAGRRAPSRSRLRSRRPRGGRPAVGEPRRLSPLRNQSPPLQRWNTRTGGENKVVDWTPDKLPGRWAACRNLGCSRSAVPGLEWCEPHLEALIAEHTLTREPTNSLQLDEVYRRLLRRGVRDHRRPLPTRRHLAHPQVPPLAPG